MLTLDKMRHTWWKCVLEGDPEIDTSKVESTKRVEECAPQRGMDDPQSTQIGKAIFSVFWSPPNHSISW